MMGHKNFLIQRTLLKQRPFSLKAQNAFETQLPEKLHRSVKLEIQLIRHMAVGGDNHRSFQFRQLLDKHGTSAYYGRGQVM